MLTTETFIFDQPLPEALDAVELKHRGIAMLKSVVGSVWSNFNDSDPGVTILDQLCYALTELGYCGQFPIEDILTREDGKIHFHDQFFEPQDILTSAPVTADDYRKLVLNAFPEVRAVYIVAEMADTHASPTGRYRSYLCLKENPALVLHPVTIIARVQLFLNQNRNLGEYFLPPTLLKPREISLAGWLSLNQSADVEKVRARILAALQDYSAPLAVQSGYNELLAAGLRPDQIFNGPKLTHGWIAGPDALRGKRETVSLCDLATLIAGVDGVQAVETLTFVAEPGDENTGTEIPIAIDQVPAILLSSGVSFTRNGVNVTARQRQSSQYHLAFRSALDRAASVPAAVDLCPPLPQGAYRDIENYYSVQNTFPDVYGIGLNALSGGGDPYRGALSRQLQGYLMAFDQLLANQFSQLAHVGELFSFNCPARGHDTGETASIPYQKFATTYHCQPLYNIPDVKPLLLGNNAFRLQYDTAQSERALDGEAWKRFCAFPFNEYIHGLRECAESDTEALTRRDAMLSHLMARHGDDAGLYDEMINASQWFGGEQKTRIIVKTVWLQNFALLSYHRARAFDLSSIPAMAEPGGQVPTHALPRLGTNPPPAGDARQTALPWWRMSAYPEIDGEVDQRRIYADARLSLVDLRRHSAFELKVGILLGLAKRWRMLAAKLSALLDDAAFVRWLKQPAGQSSVFTLPDSDLSARRAAGGPDRVFEGEQCLLDIVWLASGPATEEHYRAHADQLLWLATQTQGFLLIESVLMLDSRADNRKDTAPASELTVPCLTAWLLFPGYTTFTSQPEFAQFIQTLLDYHWPAGVVPFRRYLSFASLQAVISAYVARINAIKDASVLEAASAKLAQQLLQLNPQASARATA
jgi:hypothetical protein